MISKLWLSWEKTSTTEQEKRACSDVTWNCGQKTGGRSETGGSAGGGKEVAHPVLFVSLQSAVQKISGHFLVLVQPLDDEGFEPPVGAAAGEEALRSDGWTPQTLVQTHAGYSGTRLLKKGRSLQYSL